MLCRKYGELSLSSKHSLGHFDKLALEEALTKDDYNFNLGLHFYCNLIKEVFEKTNRQWNDKSNSHIKELCC